jgi:hypothetical protein
VMGLPSRDRVTLEHQPSVMHGGVMSTA